ncbi:MAG TPA: NDP-sugar synthase [Euryarchaeota archaeon]|nr:NDP-sugar synthase [Euryarchaeota archaeon]
MQAVMLVGGLGTRLRPLTNRLPKPLIPVMGKPLMMHVVDALPPEVDEIIIPVSYKRDMMEDYIARTKMPVKITIADEPEPRGTGGAVKNVEELIDRDDTFLVLNGDIVASVDLSEFISFHKAKGGIASMTLWEVEDPEPFGVAQLNEDGRIVRFQEKPSREEAFSKLINAGAYALQPEVLDEIGPGFVSMEREVFPKILPKGMYGFGFDGHWLDCGTSEGVIGAHVTLMEEYGSYIAESAYTYNTNLMRPFCIEPDCRIVNALIGPGTYIGGGSVILDDSKISNSVLLPGARIGRDCELDNCIIDENTKVTHGTKCRNKILTNPIETG